MLTEKMIEQKQSVSILEVFFYWTHLFMWHIMPASCGRGAPASYSLSAVIMKIHVLCSVLSCLAPTDAGGDLDGLKGTACYPCTGFTRSMKIQQERHSVVRHRASLHEQIKSFVLNFKQPNK